jgi:hypothetical protein
MIFDVVSRISPVTPDAVAGVISLSPGLWTLEMDAAGSDVEKTEI